MRLIFFLTTVVLSCQLFTVFGEKPWLRCIVDQDCQFGECRNGFNGMCDRQGYCYCLSVITEEKGKFLKGGFTHENCEDADGKCKMTCENQDADDYTYRGLVCKTPDLLPGPPPTPIFRRCICLQNH